MWVCNQTVILEGAVQKIENTSEWLTACTGFLQNNGIDAYCMDISPPFISLELAAYIYDNCSKFTETYNYIDENGICMDCDGETCCYYSN